VVTLSTILLTVNDKFRRLTIKINESLAQLCDAKNVGSDRAAYQFDMPLQ